MQSLFVGEVSMPARRIVQKNGRAWKPSLTVYANFGMTNNLNQYSQ